MGDAKAGVLCTLGAMPGPAWGVVCTDLTLRGAWSVPTWPGVGCGLHVPGPAWGVFCACLARRGAWPAHAWPSVGRGLHAPGPTWGVGRGLALRGAWA